MTCTHLGTLHLDPNRIDLCKDVVNAAYHGMILNVHPDKTRRDTTEACRVVHEARDFFLANVFHT